MAVDLDLLAAFELVGGIVILARPAADVHVVDRHVGRVGEGLFPVGGEAAESLTTEKQGDQQTHRKVLPAKTDSG